MSYRPIHTERLPIRQALTIINNMHHNRFLPRLDQALILIRHNIQQRQPIQMIGAKTTTQKALEHLRLLVEHHPPASIPIQSL